MRYVLITVMLALPMLGQEGKTVAKPAEAGVVRFVDLKHLSRERLNRVVHFVNTLNLGKAHIVHDDVLNTLAIKADNVADAAAAEEMIRRFDVPAAEDKPRQRRQIQLTVYLLEPTEDLLPAQRPPVELAGTVEQLRNLFGHKNLRLVETTILQGREGSAYSMSGILRPPRSGFVAPAYTAGFTDLQYIEAQKMVWVNRFAYTMRVPNGDKLSDSGVTSDLTIKDGQKLVIGKVSKAPDDPAGYLVVTAKVD